ncbi:ATP-dependent helicase [Georgenia wutianyii]|uniref:ATP-dependent helicase n=1 Tax=Georgenia wutianyii TaxID=2585135 RepID=A0ABX5VPW7_9MICO|nr:ATP-dependent helicase [Georgenia wutianyii]QDB78830.1 ATP-dependent helicase [Georgenia wutianyii]
MVADVLAGFSAPTRAWFAGAFAAPTAAQTGAWEAVRAGDHALVVAPTGSGKTLSAFLWSVDRLLTGEDPPPERRARVVYVSPLKALAADVERNLRSPLVGITRAAAASGTPLRDVTVGVRTGDTPPAERRALATRPPDILITTPESLYLVLTSAAREGLRGVETVILDEVHAVAGTKRGAHLAVTLERLDALLPRPAQRIGLSATVRPVEAVARFLSGARTPDEGGRPVRIVRPEVAKELQIDVVVPVPDLSDLPEAPSEPAAEPDLSGSAAGRLPGPHRASIWPHVEERLVDLITTHRSTIVFANSRRGAERLAARVNEVWAERTRPADAESGPASSADAWAAQVPGQSGTASPAADGELARAHHGSMSREERTRIETALKSGTLPAVIATSTLELGIDMGTVDLVVQVGAPPSVASALQRIGRAGHQVGALSRGVVLPTHRGDLLASSVTSVRAQEGAIEALHVVSNPLDVLAQQVVAMLAVDDWSVDELAALVRRSAPFESLGDASLHAVLDMLSGRYPSEEFAELRPRVVWDRAAGTLTARPGALRLATTSGGTIPDRGLYGVFLAATATQDGDGVTSAGRGGRRVGELDEEMVFESRVGDTFTLGSSTWRIEDITPDRVLVSPAPGQPGRLPFWKGDSPGRPVELGRALGAFVRTTAALPTDEAHARLAAQGLDEWARDNLLGYLYEQREHAHLSDDRTIVLERFRDELGDWRVVIHSPFGSRVHTPWALVLSARLRERLGMDVAAMPADDGIVLRLPDVGPEGGELPIAAEDLLLEPDEVTGLVVEGLAGSAHFASRFREAAARALLLPRRRPDRRQPLWQQRHRAAQLLGVAVDHPDFPIVLEAVRECLQDDFDTPALAEVMAQVARRDLRVVEVSTPTPSPFARSLLMGYVGQFLYDGDAPAAERRAAALTLDPRLLAELIGPGATELADLLEPTALADIEEEVGLRRHPAGDLEAVADLVRRLGPVTGADVAARCAPPTSAGEWLAELETARRVIRVTVGGQERWAAIEDAGRLRDALGVALPVGLPEGVLEPVADPLGDLVRRYARTHGPFRAEEPAAHLGLGTAAIAPVLRRLTAASALVTGRLRPGSETGDQYCDAEVLRRIRRRSLAVLRAEVEAVPATTLGAFLPRWQQVATAGSGPAALASVVDQLAGARVPASALESLVLPARVSGYRGALLDELTTAGEVLWCGAGALPGVDGYLVLAPADSPELLPPAQEVADDPLQHTLLEVLAGGGQFFRELLAACREQDAMVSTDRVLDALWELAWGGHVTNDSLAPVRARLSGGRPAHHSARRPPRASGALSRRRSLVAAAAGSRPGGPLPPAAAGRWSLVPRAGGNATAVLAQVAALLERHGVLTRGAVGLEDLPGGFATAYPVLTRLEDAGKVRRGYLVEGLGAAQFALPECVDLLRDAARRASPTPLLLAATDPANPYGAALPWPDATAEGARPRRAAGSVVVLVGGELCLYVERGGRTLLSFTTDPARLEVAAGELARTAARGTLGRLTLHRVDGEPALGAGGPVRAALQEAGFFATPRGLRLREDGPARRAADGAARA